MLFTIGFSFAVSSTNIVARLQRTHFIHDVVIAPYKVLQTRVIEFDFQNSLFDDLEYFSF